MAEQSLQDFNVCLGSMLHTFTQNQLIKLSEPHFPVFIVKTSKMCVFYCVFYSYLFPSYKSETPRNLRKMTLLVSIKILGDLCLMCKKQFKVHLIFSEEIKAILTSLMWCLDVRCSNIWISEFVFASVVATVWTVW